MVTFTSAGVEYKSVRKQLFLLSTAERMLAAGTINNKSIPHNRAGGCVAVPLLRHHSNFTTNKTNVNTEQRLYHCQSESSENTAG